MATRQVTRIKPSKQRILRAVASSTAVETNQSIKALEKKLQAGNNKFKNLSLA